MSLLLDPVILLPLLDMNASSITSKPKQKIALNHYDISLARCITVPSCYHIYHWFEPRGHDPHMESQDNSEDSPSDMEHNRADKMCFCFL